MLRNHLPFFSVHPSPNVSTPLTRRVVDAHVHIFPPRLFQRVQEWFRAHYWPLVYDYNQSPTLLLDSGIHTVILLQYAHKPGIARSLNDYMLTTLQQLSMRYAGRVFGLATIYPGEDATILHDAFASGLVGVKLHVHVSKVPLDDPRMFQVLDVCKEWQRPVLVHSGREPNAKGLGVDTYELCSLSRLRKLLTKFPTVRVCIPHMGMDEIKEHIALLAEFPNLYLDTTMAITDYFTTLTGIVMIAPDELRELLNTWHHRIMYGSDFPNLPYAWDHELTLLQQLGLTGAAYDDILSHTATAFYNPPSSKL